MNKDNMTINNSSKYPSPNLVMKRKIFSRISLWSMLDFEVNDKYLKKNLSIKKYY